MLSYIKKYLFKINNPSWLMRSPADIENTVKRSLGGILAEAMEKPQNNCSTF